MQRDIERVLMTEQQLKDRVKVLGAQISKDYADKNLLLVAVLKGSVTFLSDLMRAIDIPLRIDFMAVSSYGGGTKTSGRVKILKDLSVDICGYDVLIVEDILDSGVTLSNLMELLQTRGPRSIRICTLLNKPSRRVAAVETAYEGFSIEDNFVVGYGLDYDEKYRNLPYIGILKPEIYTNKE